MGTLAPEEIELLEMEPTWLALLPVKAFREQQAKFIREELPADAVWGAAGVSMATKLGAEFTNEIWLPRVPTTLELVEADRAGQLEATIERLNKEFLESV